MAGDRLLPYSIVFIMNRFLLLLCFFTLGIAGAKAQPIRGTVSAPSGEPIPFANIQVLNSAKATVSDRSGQFTVSLPAGTYQLAISAVGFASVIQPVKLTANEPVTLTVSLAEQIGALDEVVVTADKTETDVQKTPTAITVLNARQLREYRAWSFSDVGALAPSLQTVEHGGSSSSLFINIRGVMGLHSQSAVATYVDGVYQFESFSVPLQFNNVARIEVLRGPQGTLYGRNAFGGVINIITRKPGNRPEAHVQADVGNYGQQRYSLSVSTPIVANRLFLGVSGLFNQRRGIYTNTLTNQPFDRPQSVTGGLNLRYLPTDNLSIDFNGRFERNADLGSYPWVTSDSLLFAQPYQVARNSTNNERRDNVNLSLNVNYRTPALVFTSISAYVGYKRWFPDLLDTDFTGVDRTLVQNDNNIPTYTQEFRVASNPVRSPKLSWTIGTYGWTAPNGLNLNTTYQNLPTRSTAYRNSLFNNRGIAFFGQATYALTSQLALTAGLRYDRESRQLEQSRQTVLANGAVTQNTPPTEFSTAFEAVTPKVALSYQATDNTLAYVQVARGFRAGGLNVFAPNPADVPFGPEYSNNYEAGLKNTLFANRLRLNLTAFYLEQRGQQINVIENGFFLTRNTGDMNNLGAEVELMALPVKGLRVEWTGSLSRARYVRLLTFSGGANRDFSGNRPLFNPGAVSFLAVQYNRVLTKQWSAFIRGEHRYTGAYYLNFDNVIRQSSYHLFNARAGVTYRRYELAAWGRNLTDVKYRTWATGVFLLSMPGLWGLTATASF